MNIDLFSALLCLLEVRAAFSFDLDSSQKSLPHLVLQNQPERRFAELSCIEAHSFWIYAVVKVASFFDQ
jgi:hypothetical protein